MGPEYQLTIVVPVFNEEATVVHLLNAVEMVGGNKQIIVVDDGSTDRTGPVLEHYAVDHDISLLRHPKNLGKGAAIRTALAKATGDLLIVQDADLEYDPKEYSQLISPILSGQADVVFGSRRLGKRVPWRRLLTPFYHGVTVLNWLTWIIYKKKLTDEATCYKIFKTTDLRRMDLLCERFEFCPEVTAKACRLGLRILEVPISYTPRLVSEGKKIGFSDAVEAAQTLWSYRNWTPPDTEVSELAPRV